MGHPERRRQGRGRAGVGLTSKARKAKNEPFTERDGAPGERKSRSLPAAGRPRRIAARDDSRETATSDERLVLWGQSIQRQKRKSPSFANFAQDGAPGKAKGKTKSRSLPAAGRPRRVAPRDDNALGWLRRKSGKTRAKNKSEKRKTPPFTENVQDGAPGKAV